MIVNGRRSTASIVEPIMQFMALRGIGACSNEQQTAAGVLEVTKASMHMQLEITQEPSAWLRLCPAMQNGIMSALYHHTFGPGRSCLPVHGWVRYRRHRSHWGPILHCPAFSTRAACKDYRELDNRCGC